MLWLDHKYLGLSSGHLRNFKRKEQGLYNFSCYSCGDSPTDRRKARAYAFERDGSLLVYCHRCGLSTNVRGMLRQLDSQLYSDYLLETGLEKGRPPRRDNFSEMEKLASSAPVPEANPLSGLIPLTELDANHHSVSLATRRLIPLDLWGSLYHSDDYCDWANTLIPGKYQNAVPEPRFVIPFLREGRLIGFQGRSYDPNSKVRYLTAALDKTVPFLYGWDRLDHYQDVVAVEGPIDSMFLDNGVASAGGTITRETERAGLEKSRTIIAYDNDSRSPQVVKKMYQAARLGYKVFVWPERILEKDFNDLALTGMDRPSIMKLIHDRTFSGLLAELELNSWKRCRID